MPHSCVAFHYHYHWFRLCSFSRTAWRKRPQQQQPRTTTPHIRLTTEIMHHRGGLPAPPDPPGPRASGPGDGTGRDNEDRAGPAPRPGRAGPPARSSLSRRVPSSGPEARVQGGPGGPEAPPVRQIFFLKSKICLTASQLASQPRSLRTAFSFGYPPQSRPTRGSDSTPSGSG